MVTDMQCCPLDTNSFYRLSLAIVRRVWLSVCFQFDISIGENGESSGRSGGVVFKFYYDSDDRTFVNSLLETRVMVTKTIASSQFMLY